VTWRGWAGLHERRLVQVPEECEGSSRAPAWLTALGFLYKGGFCMKRFVLLAAMFMALYWMGCFAGPSGPMVTRTFAMEDIDLSGEWNDVDSRLVSEEMIKDMLGRPWIEEFREDGGAGRPKLVVGHVANKSHDHIPVDTFIKDLEKELINSGEVRFLASHGQRGQLSSEKEYQARAASLESQKAMGKELGADFILMGQINSIVDSAGGV